MENHQLPAVTVSMCPDCQVNRPEMLKSTFSLDSTRSDAGQRISPVVFLRTRHKRKQQEQEDDKQKPDGFKTHRQDPHRFVGCAWICRPEK